MTICTKIIIKKKSQAMEINQPKNRTKREKREVDKRIHRCLEKKKNYSKLIWCLVYSPTTEKYSAAILLSFKVEIEL